MNKAKKTARKRYDRQTEAIKLIVELKNYHKDFRLKERKSVADTFPVRHKVKQTTI